MPAAILTASRPFVPVDTGALIRSGRVEDAQTGESVYSPEGSYSTSSVNAQVGGSVLVYGGGEIDYAGVVHYRLDVKHERGQAQYVGQPLRTERQATEERPLRGR